MWRSIWLLAITACFSPRPPAGAACPDGDCPAGQRCIASVCVIGDQDPDPDAAIQPPDTARPDGPQPGDGDVVGMWSLVATDDRLVAGGTPSITITIPATQPGNTIIVAVETDDDPVISVADNAGNVYTPIANSRAVNLQEAFGVELWFANDPNPGATTITANGPELYAIVMWEVAGLAKTNPIDAVAKVDNQATSTTPLGAPITTTQPNDFVVSVAIVANAVSNVVANSPFTNDHTTFGNGWAHLTANDAPAATYQAQWNQGVSGVSCASSAAFRAD